jgi:hypothetical protein
MITKQNLLTIKEILINDESFCRLAYYGDNAMDVNLDDITTSLDKDSKMNEILWFSPQVEDLVEKEQTRIMIYKSVTKLKSINSAKRNEVIRIDLFVPHRLQRNELRIYDLENAIVNLLDNKFIRGLNNLSYSDGRFLDSPVKGFSLYRMIFEMEQGRDNFAEY